MLVLNGSPSLSKFRQVELVKALQAVLPSVKSVYAESVHFADIDGSLTAEEKTILDRLLVYGPKRSAEPHVGKMLVVIPRKGLVTPWSSKATDIAHNCALHKIKRLERGTIFWVQCTNPAEQDKIMSMPAALNILHDRMTFRVVNTTDDATDMFFEGTPEELRTVDVIGGGLQELIKANKEWGLAISDEELHYLAKSFGAEGLNRNPTDVELMMFAQVNSEHCRHKIFNAAWTINGEEQEMSLFQMIRNTHNLNKEGVISAYKDNGAILNGYKGTNYIRDTNSHVYNKIEEDIHLVIKVETHNHPTAVSPFPGAATGSGGEIRDEGACGRGSRPKAGLAGFTVSNLLIPGFTHPWEVDCGYPERICNSFQIMIDGPLGAAAFNNEFGRPNLTGYFRTCLYKNPCPEERNASGTEFRGYHKPICIVGGVGTIRPLHVEKNRISAGSAIIALGGPSMLIGLGGGAASSMASGTSSAELDFASVQRDNPEMERRCQEVIDACTSLGNDNPIESIHDVGAGGLSNAVPEIVHDADRGGRFELQMVPCADKGMSPMAIWCNESQERYVLAISQDRLDTFKAIATRERCPYGILGTATDEDRLVLSDELAKNLPIDLPMTTLFGKPPRMHRNTGHSEVVAQPAPAIESLEEAARRVLLCPAVACKEFLITIGDRSVKGLTHRDQMVGPWQVPVADVAVTLATYTGYAGEAMAMGERTPAALLNAAASARMAIAESITNLVAAPIPDTNVVKVSANWMTAASYKGEDANLYDAVKAVGMDICPKLGMAIPVGKDSMSMATQWQAEDGQTRKVVAPMSLIITSFAPVTDVRQTLDPQLKTTFGASKLVFVDLAMGKQRMGASCLGQVFNFLGSECPDVEDALALRNFVKAMYEARQQKLVAAYHDRSDGGLFTTLAEMAFAGHVGVDVDIDALGGDAISALFNEELGAVLQVPEAFMTQLMAIFKKHGVDTLCHVLGQPSTTHSDIIISKGGGEIFCKSRVELHRTWAETSYRMQAARDNPECAKEAFDAILDEKDPGLTGSLTFDPSVDVLAGLLARPKMAILREQGVNGHVEMAWAFDSCMFEAIDVHMSDLISGAVDMSMFRGMVACGGFSYGDVLGAGEGWAKCILYNANVRRQFTEFFADTSKFGLGICNGCQMLSNLKELIPGAENWPHFVRNRVEQFEARVSLVKVESSPSLFFEGMAGSRIPVAVSHGEGRAEFSSEQALQGCTNLIAGTYANGNGTLATKYPANPNGSTAGIVGVTTPDGRVTIMMPHPERCQRTVTMSYSPPEWADNVDSPWRRMFANARKWVG